MFMKTVSQLAIEDAKCLVGEMLEKLANIRTAVDAYHLALDKRQHGGVAASMLISEIQEIMDMPWVQGETLKAQNNDNEAQ